MDFCLFDPIQEDNLGYNFFCFGRKFAEIDSILCRSVYSPYKAKYFQLTFIFFKHILCTHISIFGIFGEDFVYLKRLWHRCNLRSCLKRHMQFPNTIIIVLGIVSILFAYSPTMTKYFQRILGIIKMMDNFIKKKFISKN